MESAHQPCVLLQYTSNTAESHQTHRLDKAPVGAAATLICVCNILLIYLI